MPERSIKKISDLLTSQQAIDSHLKRPFTHLKNSIKELNEETVKNKLETCLYGLSNIKQQLKKGQFYQESKEKRADLMQKENKELKKGSIGQSLNSSIKNRAILNQKSKNSLFVSLRSPNLPKIHFAKNCSSTQNLIQYFSSNNPDNSIISFKKSYNYQDSKLRLTKKILFPPKIAKHLYQSAEGKALSKQNKFFSFNPPRLDKNQIAKIGLYQSINRYKKQFLRNQMSSLSPQVQRKQHSIIKSCKQNQLFLTRPKGLLPIGLDYFLKGEFSVNQLKHQQCFETIKAEQIHQPHIENFNQQDPILFQSFDQSKVQHHIVQQSGQLFKTQSKQIAFLEFKNFLIVKNESYLNFRVSHIENWEEIQSFLHQLAIFCKKHKINTCKFKANNLLNFWSGQKLTIKDVQSILKVSKKEINCSERTPIQRTFCMIQAKRKTNSIINAKRKRVSYIRWVCDRIIAIRNIKRQTQYKIKKAFEIHEKLLEGNFSWDIEIFISSFSENYFVRNTTQYMDSYENMFTHVWKESTKHMIFVVPTINSEILRTYQQKLKIKRPITLICPEVHELFPASMSLAGCLLFSYEALNKIKRLIEGKKAVIIPGKFSDPKYQLLISEFLRTPLMASLKPKKDLQFQKLLFSSANLPVLPYISISPNTTIPDIIKQFACLLLAYRSITKWVFKLNGEFGGRGLATFCINSSKTLKFIISSCKDTAKPLEQYLKGNLQLKLKMNFENSLFMLGDYLKRLGQKGGIIEERKQKIESYEISFFIESKASSFICSFRCLSVNHSSKAYIYDPIPNEQLAPAISKLKYSLEANQYLGYVSVELIVTPDEVYGIQIKPYLTHRASVQPFIKNIQIKRQLKLNLEGKGHLSMENQLISPTLRKDFLSKLNPTVFSNRGSLDSNSVDLKNFVDQLQNTPRIHPTFADTQIVKPVRNDQFTYLFIPNIILTDVPIPKKAQLIEQMVFKSFNHCKFDILANNLVLYLSNGLSLSLLIIGKDPKKIKKTSIETVRFLSEKASILKIYCGKNEARDVFQFGDIIKAVGQIKG